nr:EOG090X00SQ [Lepidurus arcticus]
MELLNVPQKSTTESKTSYENANQPEIKRNICGIQMLPRNLYANVFGKPCAESLDLELVDKIEKHLKTHKLWGQPTSKLPEVELTLPPLLGANIAEHFAIIGDQQSKPYRELLENFVNSQLPAMPTAWNLSPGWTRYSPNGSFEPVNCPLEDVFVFDVEVCMKEGPLPTMATAVSPNAWYSWSSPQLTETTSKHYRNSTDDLLPLETSNSTTPRLAIGHNVSFDRSKVREQYLIQGSKVRFWDTMSLHIAISGLTSYQRNMLMAGKANGGFVVGKNGNEILDWQQISSFNGLKDVYQLYCGGLPLEKEARNYFVTGTLGEIRAEFQNLMTYCAKDTLATYQILCAMMGDFFERFPHPITFAGMLEMGTAYLPVNSNWERFLNDSEDTYNDMEKELTHCLVQQANEACTQYHNEKFRDDPWLWDLDWSVQDLKMKKSASKGKPKETKSLILSTEDDFEADSANLARRFETLLETRANLYKKKPFLPGYPAWYRTACEKEASLEDGSFGTEKISTSMQIVPKLLRLTWDGYPLHYTRELGWGYLVPGRPLAFAKEDSTGSFPIVEAMRLFPPREKIKPSGTMTKGLISPEEAMNNLRIMTSDTADMNSLNRTWAAMRSDAENVDAEKKAKKKHEMTSDKPSWHEGIGPYDVGIMGAWFFRLPHKGGMQYNVGNPLAKDYQSKIEDGTLNSSSGPIANYILKLSKMLSYWRNARDRIFSQMTIWLHPNELPANVTKSPAFSSHEKYGAIIPHVVIAGTLTRRAVEATWMTASNAYVDRLGSELKAMIQAPPGYHFVGADVDSQELWIAAVIGDAHFAGEHGSTAFGWMTLQGKKSAGTDMHSRTAATVDISRDQAKVLNYGRIYGAGEKFAKTLLMQFNHRLTEAEALDKAKQMYAATKGISMLDLNEAGKQLVRAAGEEPEALIAYSDLTEIRSKIRRKARQGDWKAEQALNLNRLPADQLTQRRLWVGGTESPMFNKLEEIAQQNEPVTPVLGCRISRALEPSYCGKEFMTSRINWVVQSSAVDYLHLMLVAMRYLFDTYEVSGRFCISIHDEVRYLVQSEDRYRAALALQITNVWTRAMFAYQLGMNDLPQSVAFFSSVDIDTVLRKEVNMDCKTPSNPQGLSQGYGIPFGEALDIQEIITKTDGTLKR